MVLVPRVPLVDLQILPLENPRTWPIVLGGGGGGLIFSGHHYRQNVLCFGDVLVHLMLCAGVRYLSLSRDTVPECIL